MALPDSYYEARMRKSRREALRALLKVAARTGSVEQVAERSDLDVLDDLVTDTVFAMAAGESGIPDWLRVAEGVLDQRKGAWR